MDDTCNNQDVSSAWSYSQVFSLWPVLTVLAAYFVLQALFHMNNAFINPYESGVYAAAARRVLEGEMPYRDFFFMYAPLYNAPITLATTLFKSPFDAEFVGGTIVNVSSAFLVWQLSKQLIENKLLQFLPLIFALSWAPAGNRFLFSVASFLLFSNWLRKQKFVYLFFSGFASGLAALTMQDLAPYLVVSFVVGILAENSKPLPIKNCILASVKEVTGFLLGFLLPILVFVLVLLLTSALPNFVRYCFEIPLKHYLGQNMGHFPMLFELRQDGSVSSDWTSLPFGNCIRWFIYTFPYYFIPLVCIWGIITGLLAVLRKNIENKLVLVLCLSVFGALMFRSASVVDLIHVRVSALPSILVLYVAIDRIFLSRKALVCKYIQLGIAVLSLLFCSYETLHDFYHMRKLPSYLIRLGMCPSTRSTQWKTLSAVTSELQQITNIQDSIFCIPNIPLIYVLSNRKNPTQFDYFDIFNIADIEEDAISQLNKKPPLVVVVHKHAGMWGKIFGKDYGVALMQWTYSGYVAVRETDDFVIYERRPVLGNG